VDPISILLENIVHIGVDEFRDRAAKRAPQEPDPVSRPVTGEFRARFEAAGAPRPSLVWVVLYRDEAWKMCVPVKYGDVLKLRVPRGIYKTTAWFFADMEGQLKEPLLVAIAQGSIKVISNRREKFLLRGHTPEQPEVKAIRESTPSQMLPFQLPTRPPVEDLRAGTVAVRDSGPTLEVTSSPLCAHVDDAGRRCSDPAEPGRDACTRHSAADGSDFQIITWLGSPRARHAGQPG
jgi:hypothetical protein